MEQYPPTTARRWLRVLALAGGAAMIVHGVMQGVSAAEFWRPCFEEGFSGDRCMYLQYEAAAPWWAMPWLLWLLETAIAVCVVILAARLRDRIAVAGTALALVALANGVTDYVLTPLFNGGYVSADNPPGYGILSAVLLAAGGLTLIVAAATFRRQPARVPSVIAS